MHTVASLARRLSGLTPRVRAAASRRIAELRVRLRRRSASPRTLIARLGTIVACTTIVAPPLLYALISASQLQQHALEQASIGARHIEVQLSKKGTIDWLAQASINVLHATQGATSSIIASWVTDTDGSSLMFQGRSAWWPELRAAAKINASVFKGHFHVALSTRHVFLGTLYSALAFLLLGLAAYYCFRRLPLAALDRALQRLEAKQRELLEQKDALETQNLRFDAALNNMSQALCMFDGKHELVVCNDGYARMYGLPEELTKPGTPFLAVLDRRIANGLHTGKRADEYARDVLEAIVDERPITKMIELRDGRVIAIKQRRMPDGGWISTHEDITQYRRIEAQVAHLARHDPLTDLPNRLHLRERLEEVTASTRKGEHVAVLCLDLDRFKEINDTLGHASGDIMLKAVGERLRSCLGPRDVIARLSADEFAIVQIEGEQPFAATALAGSLMEAMSQPFDFEGQPLTMDVSIGISVSSDDSKNADELLKNADLALHRAKAQGGSTYRFFEAVMDADMQARCKLQFDLRKALSNGEFELYYQPVVNLARNDISGFEALVRWKHPERGMVPPDVFIPLAEEIGFIVPLGEWALRTACATAAKWPEHIAVSVNLSPVQFRNPQLAKVVAAALAASGLPPERLELEVTETALFHDSETTLSMLYELRELGVRIAMDDFGTGYSSLSYLQSFPFDKIKIDRSFVKDITDAVVRNFNVKPEAVMVQIMESPKDLKAKGGFLFSDKPPG